MEFIRLVDNVVATHHKVSGMNFIPGGYMIAATVWEASAEAESQLVASGAVESETEPPSLADDKIFCDTQDDEDLPPSPVDEDLPPLPADEDLPPSHPNEVHIGSPHQDAGRPPAQETQVELDIELPLARDPQTLKLDIRKPPLSKELIQRMNEIIRAPQSTSKGVCLKKKKVPSSPPTPTQEDHPEDELSPPRKLRS